MYQYPSAAMAVYQLESQCTHARVSRFRGKSGAEFVQSARWKMATPAIATPVQPTRASAITASAARRGGSVRAIFLSRRAVRQAQREPSRAREHPVADPGVAADVVGTRSRSHAPVFARFTPTRSTQIR